MGEIRGVRDTIDKLVGQEMQGRPASALPQVEAHVRRVANNYERAVRDGREPPPKK